MAKNVRMALLDSPRLTTASSQSTIFDTFGEHMLTTEGNLHDRYRKAMRHAFTPAFVRDHLETAIGAAAANLVNDFESQGRADLRTAFAARLPIQVMLLLCGLPARAEVQMRRWYDSFEAALANFIGDPTIRARARLSVAGFHAQLDEAIASITPETDEYSLLAQLVRAPAAERLTSDEIKRNLSIIFFGGISREESESPTGYEFRQPHKLTVRWG